MIEGVKVVPLKQIVDDRGQVMHMLKNTDPHFDQFGEIYFSTVNPGKIKGWHIHSVMTLNYTVVAGEITLALFDEREGSATKGELQEIPIGVENHYQLVSVPPGVWNGFVSNSETEPATVANCASHPHDPDEIGRLDPVDNHIPYTWFEKVH